MLQRIVPAIHRIKKEIVGNWEVESIAKTTQSKIAWAGFANRKPLDGPKRPNTRPILLKSAAGSFPAGSASRAAHLAGGVRKSAFAGRR
jgi:hypothetical protein